MVGGMYGVNFFHPAAIRYNKVLPKVIFTRLSLFNEEVEIGKKYGGRVILDKTLDAMEEVRFTYKQNVFSVSFASDNFILPEKTKYAYRLEGFSTDWLTNSSGEVTYTNLLPGTYTLKVKAVNGDGYGSEAEAALRIVIEPPFWLTPWAFVVYAFLFVGILLLARYLILRSERNKFKIKQMEQEARKNEEINEMKLHFFTNVSHELRTPLTLIISPLEMLLKENRFDEAVTGKLSMMHRNASRLLMLVNQLLDFRRGDEKGHLLNLSNGDIVALTDNLCKSFTGMTEKKNIRLAFSSSVASLYLSFDGDKYSKILMNLLSNAFKFTPEEGKVEVAMRILKGEDEAERLEISVSDTGIGISDEDKERIFDRFYQVNPKNVEAAGSGVGLSLVRDFVLLHGGTVCVKDNRPSGSVFVVRLPMRDAVKGEDVLKKRADECPETSLRLEKTSEAPLPLALVVDDHTDFLTFMRESLSKAYRVETAENGRKAWDMIPGLIPDIIISDVMMPEMNGNELCRRVKEDKRTTNIPFILLTTYQSEEHKIEGLKLGADDYISKPFSVDVLALRMRKLISLRVGSSSRLLIEPTPSEIAITSMDEKLVDRAVKYVEKNLSRSDLSVEELSQELGMSRVHLYKKLLAITGKTPIEFIRILRLKRAAQLLRESQQNVSEIAYQVGFNNPKYFSRYFKEEYGILPSVYQDKEGK